MQTGRLRHRINIEQPVLAQDTYGDAVPTWSTLASIWGNLRAGRGAERFVADQDYATVPHIIEMRYRDDISILPSHRAYLTASGQYFDIEAVYDPDGRRRMLHLVCIENLNATTVPVTAGTYSLDFSDGTNSFYLGVF